MRHPFNAVNTRWLHLLANLLVLVLTTFLLESDSWSTDKRNSCDPPKARYESVEHAVLALSKCYLRQSVRGNREYIAGLIRDGETVFTVVGRGRSGRDQVHLSIPLKRGQSLAALWHVHGSNGHERALFSPTDVKLVKRLHVPFYLTDPTGFIWRLDPQDINHPEPRYNRMTALRPPPGSVEGAAIGHMSAGLPEQVASDRIAQCRRDTSADDSPPPEMLC